MSEPVIQSLVARRIWDSRGRPTVEAEITLSDGAVGRGIAPAGASRGSREAIDKRDGGTRFGGFDVQDALLGIATKSRPPSLASTHLIRRRLTRNSSPSTARRTRRGSGETR